MNDLKLKNLSFQVDIIIGLLEGIRFQFKVSTDVYDDRIKKLVAVLG